MNHIPCTGDFWIYRPIHDGGKIVDLHKCPIIAWEISNGCFSPIPADEGFVCDDGYIIVKDGKGYDHNGPVYQNDAEMIAEFQRSYDRKKMMTSTKNF